MNAATRHFLRPIFAAWIALLALASSAPAQLPEQILKSFGNVSQSGVQPVSVLVGADNALYGITKTGGLYNNGVVFRVNPDGSGYTDLRAFGAFTNNAQTPVALIQGKDGFLYGAASSGGTNGSGVIFSLSTDGLFYKVLHSEGDYYGDATTPSALLQGADGFLYGLASSGGTNGSGAAFKISTSGSSYSVIYNFGSDYNLAGGYFADGANPFSFSQGKDGVLYGVTQQGGTNSQGLIFRLSTNGSVFKALYSFGDLDDDISDPISVALGANGNLFGLGQTGGSTNYGGAIFTLHTNGSGYHLLHAFTGTLGDGAQPVAPMIPGRDGSWYGTTRQGGSAIGVGSVFRLSGDGSAYETIRRFDVITSVLYDVFGTDGQEPGVLAQGPDGRLYGVTAFGGASGQGGYQESGGGTLFSMETNTTDYAVIHDFSIAGGDAQKPISSLLLGRDGYFYGVSQDGGPAGQGAVFKISPNGANYQIIYGFGLDPIDGAYPMSGLTQGSDGYLYGSTSQGGYGGGSGFGAIFKLSPDGSQYAEILSFGFWAPDGDAPTSSPIQGLDGNLYGTTSDGGPESAGYGGFGIIYTVNTQGLGYQILHEFSSNNLEGRSPYGGLVQTADGYLYGTTAGGQSYDGSKTLYGSIFKMQTNGNNFQVIHTFAGGPGDGASPYSGLTLGADGFFYGTTFSGGSNSYNGTVFRISRDGLSYKILHSFGSAPTDGSNPWAGVVQGGDGFLYGTTKEGGSVGFGYGVAYKINTNYTILCQFGSAPGDSRTPMGGLTFGPDGGLYGSATLGGVMNAGTLFHLGLPAFNFASYNITGKNITFNLTGLSNTTCRIDTSPDLVTWTTLTNIPNPTRSTHLTPPTTHAHRFFRAHQGP
jgi:uncharacterized repeat protein (TIGR03803 family)